MKLDDRVFIFKKKNCVYFYYYNRWYKKKKSMLYNRHVNRLQKMAIVNKFVRLECVISAFVNFRCPLPLF